MSGNCNSSPLSGCTDSKTLEALVELSEMVETSLTTIINQKVQIIIDLNNCSQANNDLLEDIIDNYETLIADDCCDEINANLQDIIDALNSKVNANYCDLDGELECDYIATTTVEPTTTTAPEPTTTSVDGNIGTFYVSDIMQLPCIEESLPAENEQTLYYSGVFGVGTQMFTDTVDGTPLSGYSYIKKLNSLSVYNIGDENGVVGTLAYTCE